VLTLAIFLFFARMCCGEVQDNASGRHGVVTLKHNKQKNRTTKHDGGDRKELAISELNEKSRHARSSSVLSLPVPILFDPASRRTKETHRKKLMQ